MISSEITSDMRNQGYDESFFLHIIRLPEMEINRLAEEKKAAKDALVKGSKAKLDNLRQISRDTKENNAQLLKLQVDSELLMEEFPKFNAILSEIQEFFNNNVDAFNELKEKLAQNQETFLDVSKVYNDRSKKIEDYGEELFQKGKNG